MGTCRAHLCTIWWPETRAALFSCFKEYLTVKHAIPHRWMISSTSNAKSSVVLLSLFLCNSVEHAVHHNPILKICLAKQRKRCRVVHNHKQVSSRLTWVLLTVMRGASMRSRIICFSADRVALRPAASGSMFRLHLAHSSAVSSALFNTAALLATPWPET